MESLYPSNHITPIQLENEFCGVTEGWTGKGVRNFLHRVTSYSEIYIVGNRGLNSHHLDRGQP